MDVSVSADATVDLPPLSCSLVDPTVSIPARATWCHRGPVILPGNLFTAHDLDSPMVTSAVFFVLRFVDPLFLHRPDIF